MKALETGMGSCEKLEMVLCGRHKDGSRRSLKIERVAETFIEMFCIYIYICVL